jgi:hypothetical protein
MRHLHFRKGETYYLANSGGTDQLVCSSDVDRARLLFLLLYFQGERSVRHVSEHVERYIRTGSFRIRAGIERELLSTRRVELLCFTLMPGFFEILAQANTDDGISRYMHAVLVAYTKYFNARYRRRGHLFQGPFIACHAKNPLETLQLSAHIHRRARALPKWRVNACEYPFSSYCDYTHESRFGALLETSPVRSALPQGAEYKKFVEKMSAKELLAALKGMRLLE